MDEGAAITQLLSKWKLGEAGAREELIPLVYEQLRRMAAARLGQQNAGHTLRPTALVHEAYLKLSQADLDWKDRNHFLAVAARAMRQVLVDHARNRQRQKRGSGAQRVTLEDATLISSEPSGVLLDLDEALDRLKAIDARKAEAIELLYFGGLTYEEASANLSISVATLHREVTFAKAWLRNELSSLS